jgi:hypothetical protein
LKRQRRGSSPRTETDSPLNGADLETLDYLQRAIELAEGFTLFFARCDQPTHRDQLMAHLNGSLALNGHAALRLDAVPPAIDLLSRLQEMCRRPVDKDPVACIHICGLEEALSPKERHPAVLRHLNTARDRFRTMPCPLLFWLPEAALTRMAQGAPDFWAWRSGLFSFEPIWIPPSRDSLQPEPDAELLLQAEERIRILEGLLEDYRSLGKGQGEQRIRASLLVDLASLYQVTYRPETARKRLAEALRLVRRLGDPALESRAEDVRRSLQLKSL